MEKRLHTLVEAAYQLQGSPHNEEADKLDKVVFVMERNFLWLGGTTTNSLTTKINISQYARETKHLTLRDIESYLVSDG